jgi:hypothetical protein
MDADRERLQVADAARREWEEATAAEAEAAEQARTELGRRGPARWDEDKPSPRSPQCERSRPTTPPPNCGARHSEDVR